MITQILRTIAFFSDKEIQEGQVVFIVLLILLLVFFFFAFMAHLTVGINYRFHYEGCNVNG